MWSLPDINRLNAVAAENKSQIEDAIQTGVLDGEELKCEHDGDKCEGEVHVTPYFDIFSDNPKGVIALCERHDGYYGSPDEGYFTCNSCDKVFIQNYTWELYYHIGDGEILCLPCYAEQEIADNSNWIQLNDAGIDGVDFDTVKKAKHLIGVRMPTPKGIEFVNNVEFDSYTGQSISGGGVDELRGTLQELRDKGYKRAILILDAAYQFAVSIGVYVDVKCGCVLLSASVSFPPGPLDCLARNRSIISLVTIRETS